MTRLAIKRRLGIIAEEICMAERWLAVAQGGVAESWRARLALLEEEQRVLEGYFPGLDQSETSARSS